jgi:hypothetical protein
MFQSATVCTASLYSAQCLQLEQDSPVIAYFKLINSVLHWNVIVMKNNKRACSSISRILTIFYSGATGIIHYFNLIKCIPTSCCTGRDSSVGTATRYGLDGPGIESLWVRDFPHPSRPALGSTQPPIQWVPGLFQG